MNNFLVLNLVNGCEELILALVFLVCLFFFTFFVFFVVVVVVVVFLFVCLFFAKSKQNFSSNF